MKLENHPIYCFSKGSMGVDVKFWTFGGWVVTKIEQVQTRGEGLGPKSGPVVVT